MKIVIVGGGIGGLMTAVALHRQGHADVQVLEQAGQLQPIGAGVQLAANATRVLRHHGFLPALERVGVRGIGTWYKDLRTDEMLHKSETGTWGEQQYGAPYIFVHRADLQAMLLDALPAGWLRTGAAVADVGSTDRGAHVLLADGTRIDADVVIGADGLNAKTRDFIVPRTAPEFSGVVTWRALIPAERIAALGLQLEPACHDWMGPDRIVAVYWCAGGRLLNLLAAVPAQQPAPESWSTADPSGLLQASFADAHPTVRALLGAATTPFVTGIFDRPTLPAFHRQRVVLVGDAAHPFVPYLSNGAAQAIEDAHVIATELTRARDGEFDLDTALHDYAARRRETRGRGPPPVARVAAHAPPGGRRKPSPHATRATARPSTRTPRARGCAPGCGATDVIADTERPLAQSTAAAAALDKLPVWSGDPPTLRGATPCLSVRLFLHRSPVVPAAACWPRPWSRASAPRWPRTTRPSP